MPAPNAFAFLMISLWPLIAWALWARLDAGRALIWTILAGYLVLPPLTAINLPAVPDLDKATIPNLMCLVLALFLLRDRVGFDPKNWIGRALMVMFVLSPFATVMTNAEPIRIEAGDIKGLTLYDSVASVANQAIVILPFFLARRYLATPEAMRDVLVALMVAGLAYSLPMFLETLLSPQMNVWFYGFFQHEFGQTMRASGFRPVVFLPHGLWAAFFALMCLVAAVTLMRTAAPEDRPKYLVICGYLGVLLLACKSAAPMLYALALIPLILVAGRRAQIVVATTLAVIVVTYPLLRGAHLVPVDQMVELAAQINPARSGSLAFRIENEEALLARAAEKPWFGWGGYGRNLILDPETGRVLSIADGAWIIVLGIYGWMGYIAEFGLIALPLILLGREAVLARRAALSPHVAAVALILAVNMVDMLPNATMIPFTWLMAGALMGHAQSLRAARKARIPSALRLQTAAARTVI